MSQLCPNYFSTRVPVSSFIQVIGNSEQWKMTGQAGNVGFLATGSGVKQFQLSLGGCSVLQCRRFFPELRFHATNLAQTHAACNFLFLSSFTPWHFNRRRATAGRQTKKSGALRPKPASRFVARPSQRGRPVEVTLSPVLRVGLALAPGPFTIAVQLIRDRTRRASRGRQPSDN